MSITLRLLDAPISFHRCLVEPCKGVAGALFMSQAIYWTNRTKHADGWFYKTAKEWHEETGLTDEIQATIRKKLGKDGLGIIEEKLQGLPAKLWYRVNIERLDELLGDDGIDAEATFRGGRKLSSVEDGNLAPSSPEPLKLSSTTTTTTSVAEQECSAVVAEIPLKDGSLYPVTASEVERYEDLYPKVEVELEIQRMAEWSSANPTRRKTKAGIRAFINNWLSRDRSQPPRLNGHGKAAEKPGAWIPRDPYAE